MAVAAYVDLHYIFMVSFIASMTFTKNSHFHGPTMFDNKNNSCHLTSQNIIEYSRSEGLICPISNFYSTRTINILNDCIGLKKKKVVGIHIISMYNRFGTIAPFVISPVSKT